MRHAWVGIVGLAALVGCGPHHVNVNDLPPEVQAQVREIRVYDAAQLVHMTYTVIDPTVEGVSCKHLLTSADASNRDAYSQLRYAAFQEGANGLTALRFTDQGRTPECWHRIVASGEALQITQSTAAQ